jgi:hypothetical protein
VADLRGEIRLARLVRHVDALAVEGELPAVIRAAHPALFVPPEEERRAAVRTELADQSGAPARRAVDDQSLAEQLDALDTVARANFRREHDGDPVPAQQCAHRRARTRMREDLVVFAAQHGPKLLPTALPLKSRRDLGHRRAA